MRGFQAHHVSSSSLSLSLLLLPSPLLLLVLLLLSSGSTSEPLLSASSLIIFCAGSSTFGCLSVVPVLSTVESSRFLGGGGCGGYWSS